MAHLPRSGKGGRRDETGGTVRAGTTSGLRRGNQSAGSSTALWDRPADGGEDAGVLGTAWLSTEPAAGATQAGPVCRIIERILEEDKSRPAKQRHTAKRIFERLRAEHGYEGGVSIVRAYVHEHRQWQRAMFVPLRHDPGHGQVDFGEALAVIAGEECKIHFFAMDLPHSDACLVQAYPAESSEAFCEGHNTSFEFFGGVPRSILYDNLKLAVARILGDGTSRRTRIFSELQSHYLFADRFGRPGKGNDKGKVEGLVGYARRNFMVPIPRAASFAELNAQLLECCRRRLNDPLRGHDETIGDRLARDREALLRLPPAPYEACEKKPALPRGTLLHVICCATVMGRTGSEFCKRVDAMGITEVVTAPRSPWQNPFVERVMGSIRRECLDRIVIFNERHLRRVLSS